MDNQTLKAMTKEELNSLYSNLTDLALYLIDRDVELYVWEGYYTITIFKYLPDKFKDTLPFKHTIYGDLYLRGKYKLSDVIILILDRIEIINLLLGNTKIKH